VRVNVGIQTSVYFFKAYCFCIDDTSEMRTSGCFKICISIDNMEMLAKVFISNGDKRGWSKEAERPRESESVSLSAG
jgi:hypothetical protein